MNKIGKRSVITRFEKSEQPFNYRILSEAIAEKIKNGGIKKYDNI